jgi:hypothetical protein
VRTDLTNALERRRRRRGAARRRRRSARAGAPAAVSPWLGASARQRSITLFSLVRYARRNGMECNSQQEEWAGQREKQLSSMSSSGVRLVAVSGRGCMRDRFELFLWAWRVGWDRSIMGSFPFLFLLTQVPGASCVSLSFISVFSDLKTCARATSIFCRIACRSANR